jgi:translation initiation factor IF-2
MNKRVHEIAKERGLPAKQVLERLQAAGIDVNTSSSSVDEAVAARALGNGGGGAAAPSAPPAAPSASAAAPGASAAAPQPRSLPRRVKIDDDGPRRSSTARAARATPTPRRRRA